MRLILGLLALANLRWAEADIARAARLQQDVDAAQDAAEAHLRQAHGLFDRARMLRS